MKPLIMIGVMSLLIVTTLTQCDDDDDAWPPIGQTCA